MDAISEARQARKKATLAIVISIVCLVINVVLMALPLLVVR